MSLRASCRWHAAILVASCLILAAIAAPTPFVRAQTLRAAPSFAPGADAITAPQLRAYLGFIADDDREGRATPSRGLDASAQFLAAMLARSGLSPAGDDGTYFQRFALTRRVVTPEPTQLTLGSQTFTYGADFLAEPVATRTSGGLLFVGHGYQVPAKGLNPYKDLDVRDKILIAQAGLPEGLRDADVRGRPGTTWESAQSFGQKNGAKAVILVPDFLRLSRWNTTSRTLADTGRLVFPLDTATPTLPTVTASAGLLDALFARERISAAELLRLTLDRKSAESFALAADKTLSVDIQVLETPAPTQNVVARLEGRDPLLKDEVVALGAHYDHVGTRASGTDRVFNGADDDGSGTAAVLAIAEAFASQRERPKRSLLFVWHAGEESGLLGSRWFTEHPPVPIGQVIAQLNIDMVGRSRARDDRNPKNSALTGPNELYVIGSKRMSRELGELSERVNRSYLELEFNYKYDDPDDPERFFYRSDHYNYARRGVPIIFYFSGVHEDYHEPSDTIDKIDFDKLTKVSRTVFAMAASLADRPQRPKVDTLLPASVTDRE